ncbi:MAG: ATP/GTP-binding protein [Armatimonadota bacterium]
MASINYAQREISCKIVYYGCAMCGKTTNLQYVHDKIPAREKGNLVSLATETDRTLFFDFLPLEVETVGGFNTKFQLYTVPGQVFYNATRKLVLRGVDGIVFVADSQWDRMKDNVESFRNLEENLHEYNYKLDEIPYVLQYNKRDLPDVATVEFMEFLLNNRPQRQLSFQSIATEGAGVFETLNAVCKLVLKSLQEKHGAGERARGQATLA